MENSGQNGDGAGWLGEARAKTATGQGGPIELRSKSDRNPIENSIDNRSKVPPRWRLGPAGGPESRTPGRSPWPSGASPAPAAMRGPRSGASCSRPARLLGRPGGWVVGWPGGWLAGWSVGGVALLGLGGWVVGWLGGWVVGWPSSGRWVRGWVGTLLSTLHSCLSILI